MNRLLRGFLILGCVAFAAAAASAQDFPARPVKVLVGYTAGGAVDIIARAIGQQLAASLGQPVVVENKPGAGTNIAMKALIDSPPDGYTLMLAANALAANPALYQPAPFDPAKDITPIALVGRVPVVIAVGAQTPYATLSQLIAAARAKPGTITYATPGNGSTPHLATALFERAAGITLAHIPYRGGAQAITDVVAGHVQVVAMNALEVDPQAKAGRLRVLAVMSPGRSPIFPDAPTIAESGYPGFEAAVWYGLIGPANLPPPIASRLHADVNRALRSQDVRDRLAAVGGEVTPATTAQFAALVASERTRYDRLIRDAAIKPD